MYKYICIYTAIDVAKVLTRVIAAAVATSNGNGASPVSRTNARSFAVASDRDRY